LIFSIFIAELIVELHCTGTATMNLNQITLPSTDVARSVEFYRALGFTQIVSNLPSYARFECPMGGSTFSLHQVDNVAPNTGVVVYFECNSLDAKFLELTARGFVFDSPPADESWLWREAYLRDPDGNVLCLYFAGENRLNPPWRMSTPTGTSPI
jgi:catechol 2,3-dioxygenase-like lactoylglutathione lyase family enzyme